MKPAVPLLALAGLAAVLLVNPRVGRDRAATPAAAKVSPARAPHFQATRRPEVEKTPEQPVTAEACDLAVSEILVSEATNQEKAGRIGSLWPKLPEESQIGVAMDLCHLTDDADYASLVWPILLSRSGEATGTDEYFLNDLLARSQGVQRLCLGRLAKAGGHPLCVRSRELLSSLPAGDP